MAVWNVVSTGKGEICTTPEFPGYVITHVFGSDRYLLHTPSGKTARRMKFRECEKLVRDDSKLDENAVQVKQRGEPEWLRERANDPYGTPNKHEFWEGVDVERVGVYKLFERAGVVHAYDTKHNAWLHFPGWAEAKQHCIKPPIDPWA